MESDDPLAGNMPRKDIAARLRSGDRLSLDGGAAARRSGKVGMAGYMQVYDPAYEAAQAEVDGMNDIRFIQVNHLHTDNNLHLNNFRVKHFDDVSAGQEEEARNYRTAAKFDALGEVPVAGEQAHGYRLDRSFYRGARP
jgi:hypothetical protein